MYLVFSSVVHKPIPDAWLNPWHNQHPIRFLKIRPLPLHLKWNFHVLQSTAINSNLLMDIITLLQLWWYKQIAWSNVPYSFHPFTLPWTNLITNNDFRLFTTQVDLNLINNIVHLYLVGVLGNPINFKEMLVLLITH